MKQAARASHTADAHLLLASCHSNSGRWVQWYPRFEVLILLPHQVYSCVIAMSCITLMPLLENSCFFFSYVPTVYRTGMVLGDGCPLQGAELHSQAVNQPSAWIPWPLSHQLHTSLCSQDASWKAERLKKICLNANKQCIVPVVPDPAAGICV